MSIDTIDTPDQQPDPDDRRRCDRCGNTTERTLHDGTRRHGWCETPPAWPWGKGKRK